VLPFAGFVASDGDATLPGMIAAATVGSLAGAWVLYGGAAWIGPSRLHSFLVRHGRWARVTPADVVRAEQWFDRRGTIAVLVGRCVPLIRSLVSIPAGFRHMPFLTFTIFTLLGSLVWNAALISTGYVLRDNWEDVEPILDVAQYVVVAIIVLAIGWFVWSRFLSSGARRRPRPDAVSDG
jgi:membrane protein DedA with SNARE-associated domain